MNGERPPAVTAAGVKLIIGGVLEAIAGLLLIFSIAGVFNLLSIRRAPFTSVVSLAIDVFIVWALTQDASYFSE